ncbi:hypothetical protein SCALM49S_04201 [Streptomyces californicus]
MLILDEATSALDTRTDRRRQEAIDALSAGRTTLTIAHRLSTVRDADQIVVLEGGRIAERGTHEDLLARARRPLRRTDPTRLPPRAGPGPGAPGGPGPGPSGDPRRDVRTASAPGRTAGLRARTGELPGALRGAHGVPRRERHSALDA